LFPATFALGPSDVGVNVGDTPTSESPSPQVVFKQPSGCLPAPTMTSDGRLPHNLYNQTNVDVLAYADGACTAPLLRIKANQGSHIDYLFHSFRAVAPIDSNSVIGGANVGVGVAPSSEALAPVTIYVIETQPLANFDPVPTGCQVVSFIPGATQIAPHSMLNNGTGTLRIYEPANCTGGAVVVAPGYVAHLAGSQSWSYTPAGATARASTRAASGCVRARSRSRSRSRNRSRSAGVARIKTCSTAARTAAGKKTAHAVNRH